jgi:hypothetical protein
MTPLRKRIAAVLALLAVLAGGGTVVVTLQPDDPAAPPATITTKVDGPDADRKADDAIVLAPSAKVELSQAATATEAPGDTHAELAAPLREPDDGPVVLNEGPLAASELPGCRTRFVANSSSRNGVVPSAIILHQTVSRDRPGVADQDGLTAFANTRRSGVSWHALIGGIDGLCTYNVPLNLKAWTASNANSATLNIEVQAFGDEPQYVTMAGRATLIRVMRAMGHRYDIPMRRAVFSNCRVVKSGVGMHRDLGACGGGHVDVSSTKWQRNPAGGEIAGWQVAPLIREAASGGITATDRVTCRKLNSWRNAGRPHGGAWERNSVRRKRAMTARGVTCTSRGPVRA